METPQGWRSPQGSRREEYLKSYGIPMEYLWSTYGIPMEQHRSNTVAYPGHQGSAKGFPPGAVTSRANKSMIDMRRRYSVCFGTRVGAARWGLPTCGREVTVHAA